MFEACIWDTKTDLGPLAPNWFEELTVKASRKDETDVGESMATGPSSHDIAFKPPGIKAEMFLASQTSTPKLLHKPPLDSPEFLTKGTPASAQVLLLKESSLCPFGSEKESGPFNHQRSTELKIVHEQVETPKRFSSEVAQRISESLGAQINPDLSWSSSFNTPSSLTPTLILSKRQEPSSAVKTSAERIVFVRQLFPPVFKDDILETSEAGRPFIEEAKEKKIDCSPEEDNYVSCGWKQRVPDAIDDGELRTTVERVLDGTEDVLSFLFTSRKSSLQRVRTREQVERRLTSALQEDPQALDATVAHRKLAGGTKPDLPFSDLAKPGEISYPLKKRDYEITQWTPLSLSEISGSNIEQVRAGDSSTDQQTPQHMQHQKQDDASQHNLQTSLLQVIDGQESLSDMQLNAPQVSTLDASCAPVSCAPPSCRKPKKFIYPAGNSSQDVRQRFNKPLHQYQTVPTQQQTPNTHRSRSQVCNSTIFEKDVDMSQLCKAFAVDFGQEVCPSTSFVKHEEVVQGQSSPNPPPVMNMDAGAQPLCERQTDTFDEQNGSSITGQNAFLSQLDISNNHNNNTTSSDGHSTTGYEASRCFTASQSQAFSGFKTANSKTICISQEAVNVAKDLLDAFAGTDLTDSTALHNRDGSDNTEGTQDCRKSNHVLCPGQKNTRLPPDRRIATQKSSTPHYPLDVCGFKTATDRRINVSSSSLWKAKKMFKELEDESSIDNNLIGVQLKEVSGKPQVLESDFDVKSISPLLVLPLSSADACSALTASQKADVSELCSLLEDANSQCEFTQVKPAKVNSSKPQESAQQAGEREWDPDILTGINFDDSFSNDIEHHKSVQRDGVKLNNVLHINVENMSVGKISQSDFKTDLNTSVENVVNVQGNDLGRSQNSCAGMINNQKSMVRNPEFIDTSGRSKSLDNCSFDSDSCIKEEPKAALSRTSMSGDESIFGKTILKMNFSVALNSAISCSGENLCGFRTAGGRKVLVSETALLQAKAFLSHCIDSDHKEFEEELGDVNATIHKHGKMLSGAPTGQEESTVCGIGAPHSLKTTITGITLKAGIGGQSCGLSTEGNKMDCVSVEALPNVRNHLDKVHQSYECESNQQNANSVTQVVDIKSRKGYRTVSQKVACVSTKAHQDASTLTDRVGCAVNSTYIETMQGTQLESNLMGCNPVKRDSGFRTARGKSVLVSEKALLKARSILSETAENSHCDAVKHVNDFTNSSMKTLPVTKNPEVLISGKPIGEDVDLLMDSDVPEKREHETDTGHSDSGKSFGFSTANGKLISVSSTALQKAQKLLNECVQPQGLEQVNGSTVEPPPVQRNSEQDCLGFSTASGKGIYVSAESVQAVKALLTDCDSLSKINCIKIKHAPKNGLDKDAGSLLGNTSEDMITGSVLVTSGDISISEHSIHNPGVTHCGFSTASGKLVSVSSIAVEHARHLFDESLRPEDSKPLIGVALQHDEQKDLQDRGVNIYKASGKSVSMSATTLKSVHAIFDDCGHVPAVSCGKNTKNSYHTDSEANNILSSPNITPETQNEGTKCGEHSTISFGFSTASGKDVAVSKKALKEAYKQLEKCGGETLPKKNFDIAPEKHLKPAVPPDSERNQCNISYLSRPPKRHSSGLSFQSDGLSNCTTTQQRYFEQEADACTKALLEDEYLHDTLHGTSGASPVNPHVEKRWSGKRDWEYDDSKDQPPLKRRLLTEFNKSKRPLVPLKSFPNGVLNDRTVTCNVSLKPNITQPHRTTMTPKRINEEPELTTPVSYAKQQEKLPVFVPPFIKQTNPEHQKGEKSLAHRAPRGFVPPFKTKVNDCKRPFDSVAGSEDHTEMHEKCNGFVPVMKKICPHAEACIQDCSALSDLSHSRILPCRDGDDLNHKVEHGLNHEAPNTDVHTEGYKSPSPSEEALHCIQLAREMQDMRIRKKRQTIRPLPGSLFLAKTSGVARVSLRAAVGYKCPRQHSEERLYMYGVPSEVCHVSSGSAKSFKFPWKHFFKWEALSQAGGVQLADGGWLIPDHRGMLGKEQFYRALCDTPGVDPQLISEEWVYNHYRWIVWKRASMERAFPQELGGICLTPEQVLLQLKYRYDVEVDRSQRSALRKIMERDDSPAKTLVLCVCDVETSGTTGKTEGPISTIWLTDGWYMIRAALDPPLTTLLQRGCLSVGDKLVTHGAELVGSQDACPPLEAPKSLMLKISANSTRPARWDTRLGYHCDPRPFQLQLDTLFSDGGVVGCVNLLVLRSYPMQWMEKTAGGVFIFRSERAEEREARSHEEQKQKAMESLFSRIQTQLEKEEEQKRKNRRVQKQTLSRREMETLQDGEELHEAMESDPTYLQADLREEQLASLCSFRRSLEERRQAQLQDRFRRALQEAEQGSASCASRDVTPVWKLAVCDANRQQSSSSKGSIFLLNIWRPSMELVSLLKEGGRYRAYHLSTSEDKRKASTAAISLTATKKTHFEHMKVVPELLQEVFEPRQCPSFNSLQRHLFHSTYGEVDVVGYVIYISVKNGLSPVLYLVDERVDFVSVRCSNTLRQLAVEELVKPQTLLIVSNALIHQASAPIPALYAGDFTAFRTSSSEPHTQERTRQLKSLVQNLDQFFKSAEEKLSNLIPMQSLLTQSCSSLTSDPCQNAWNKQPQLPITPVGKGTLATGTSEGNHPKSLKRRRGFEYLSRIPSPPSLSPLVAAISPHVKKTFNPPRRSDILCTKSNTSILSPQVPNFPRSEDEWVKDEELALINTQNLLD
ncbi:breast cancer type 2 susceptibility protein isoform X1 [Alosa alosa]|uniref:breast cancer type 2 susceptibility protein isoform X1 n=1 Tax=Alosa alosa TaxID=278164 RepID=UPI0020151BF6|nr:breast cancer type 2 susceptibility protein isoform X1 [Alosa alosa]